MHIPYHLDVDLDMLPGDRRRLIPRHRDADIPAADSDAPLRPRRDPTLRRLSRPLATRLLAASGTKPFLVTSRRTRHRTTFLDLPLDQPPAESPPQ
ncbi:hypothetical protein [Nonomuraea coxensis]|uniref:hypothetical protein n=1 Tax=Nonomuraea coxensis TaxID=404386 RepID=UPI00039FFACC|nr:hypothetical protein [Nonomuraea coxensis]